MPNEIRKMAFWEIAKGTFAKELQGDFEKAQEIANRRGAVVSVTGTITIYPEHKQTPGYGGVEFQTSIKQPPKKSMRHVTKLKGFHMIKDGFDADEINQLDLNLPEVKQTPFVPETARSGVMDPKSPVQFDPEKHIQMRDGEIIDKATGEVIG